MTKKEVLQKCAGLSGFLASLGGKIGNRFLKNSPKITNFAAKRPSLFSGLLGGTTGAAMGAGIGSITNPGIDENGKPKSRFGNALKGGLIGGLAGGGIGSIGKRFGQGIGLSNDPAGLKNLVNTKSKFHPIRKTVTTAAVLGGATAAAGLAGKLQNTQSRQASQGNGDEAKYQMFK